MKHLKYGPLFVVAAALLWSLDGLLRRHLYVLPAPVIVFWEHLIGFIVLLPIIVFSWRAFKKLTRRQWLAIAGVAFLSGAVGTILYTAALGQIHYIDFSVVVLLQQLNPIFAILAAALLLKEPLGRRFFGLAAVALAGAYIVTFPHLNVNLTTGSGTAKAAMMAVGAAAAWGVSTAFSRYALEGTSSLHITAARFGFTPIFALFFVFASGSQASLGSLTSSQWLYILAITFSTGMVALAIYYYGLKRTLASRAAILELAWPMSAIFVSYVWLNQHFTTTQLIGAIMLLVSIILIARDRRTAVEAKPNKPAKPALKSQPAKV